MLKNASIGSKLFIIAIIPIIAMIVISSIAIASVNTTFSDMHDKIKAQNYEAISLVLNADRDMYQAMLALELIMHDNSPGAVFEANKANLETNISEAEDRIQKAEEKFTKEDKYWGTHLDKNNRLISEYFSDFDIAFGQWKSEALESVKLNIPASDSNFKVARESLNLIGEMIDEATEEIIGINEKSKNTQLYVVLVINGLILLGIIFLLYRLIRMISTPVKELTGYAEKISQGETEFEFIIDSTDEIGRLKKAFSNMVNDLKLKAETAYKISNGNLDVEIIVRTDKDKLSISMENLRKTLFQMVQDINVLTKAALNGELSTRSDTSKHQGDFKKIIEGINATMDAIVTPINEVSQVMESVAKGNLSTSVSSQYRGDYAKLADSVNKTVFNLKNIIDEIAGVLEQMSGGVLDMDDVPEYDGDYSRISESINAIIAALNELVGEITIASNEVENSSRQVSDGSMQLSQGATEQASSIEELSASMTQVATQTKMNATNAAQANQLALEAKENAVKGNNRMKDMLKSMEDINDASENISKIIKVIDEIAFQTNILALNAAVEAARAGQHGKGFAVVAEEVRNLAARSADAANETTEFIEATVKKVEGGTKIASETASSLLGIVESSAKVADLVGNIAEASNEQASGISQINIGIEQVSRVIQTNSATAEESAAASEELMAQAQLLNENVSRFRLRNENNLTSVTNGTDFFKKQQNQRKKSGNNTTQSAVMKKKLQITKGNTDYGKY